MRNKNYRSLILAGFGLLIFAGCSTNEPEAVIDPLAPAAGDMIVTVEELTEDDDIATRSFMSRDMKTHLWSTTDEMRVYDPTMVRYDIYNYKWVEGSTGVFRRIADESNFTEDASYALFYNQDVEGGYFDRDRTTFEPILSAKFRIGTDASNTVTPMVPGKMQQDGKEYFTDYLPRWGEVTRVNDGLALHTSLKFLTAVLRLQLTGFEGKANLIRVQMLQGGTKALNIAGIFTANLSVNGETQPDANLAQDTYKKRSGGTEIIADLSGLSGSIVVYVPLVTTTTPVDIVVSASADGGSTYTEFKRFKNKTVTRGKVYGNSQEYDFANAG